MEFIFVFGVLILNVVCYQACAEDVEGAVNSKVPEVASAELSSLLPTLVSSVIPPAITDNSPCLPYNPPVPDFWVPDRRVSEVKCYEYIWQLKLREDKAKRSKQCREQQHVPGIIGGHSTLPGEYPNMAAIGWKAVIGEWRFMCGGTLISPNFVLTAAHCSSASERDTTIADVVPKIVRLGVRNIEETNDVMPPLDVEITRIIVHPNYTSPKQYFDIALMELKNEVTFTKDIQPACLWPHHDVGRFGRQVTVTGWGVLKSGSTQTSPELQATVVDVINSTTCGDLLRTSCNRNWCGLKEHQLCAGKLKGGADACQGDSGGPLQVKIPLPVTTQGNMNYVIGVTSFGIGCGLPDLPGVYTRVSTFIDWIESNVWPTEYKLHPPARKHYKYV